MDVRLLVDLEHNLAPTCRGVCNIPSNDQILVNKAVDDLLEQHGNDMKPGSLVAVTGTVACTGYIDGFLLGPQCQVAYDVEAVNMGTGSPE